MKRRQTLVIVGMGVAGAIVAQALRHRDDVEVICLERAAAGAHAEAGTGLNVGPNAMKALALSFPEIATRLSHASLPWRHWTTGLTDGTILWDLSLSDVADNPGIRIRWSELYRVLREPLSDVVRFGATLTSASFGPGGASIKWTEGGEAFERDDVALVLGCDGRYGMLRETAFPPEEPQHLGVVIYRVLFPAETAPHVDEYGQWFAGSNRLLAFRIPGDAIYCAGSFPIAPGAAIPEDRKSAEVLRDLYTLPSGLSDLCEGLVRGIVRNLDQVHWARVQENEIRFAHPSGRLALLGDAAHPMVPTLGQGATQAIEDACVAAGEIVSALDNGRSLSLVPWQIERRRSDRVRFVMDLSRASSDSMLMGADPVQSTRWKREAPFMRDLSRLYRDIDTGRPEPFKD
jgi:2-polyprenyl-6-methoxyphenol hydroxylase-like FAD-dependent oxidoreductase